MTPHGAIPLLWIRGFVEVEGEGALPPPLVYTAQIGASDATISLDTLQMAGVNFKKLLEIVQVAANGPYCAAEARMLLRPSRDGSMSEALLADRVKTIEGWVKSVGFIFAWEDANRLISRPAPRPHERRENA